ncbi:hypothetical protein Psta_3036 [Pirellula staleyi DSM 6068]|uniref:Uncharacterized protein n=1 Tax=Pirellula staleyi (strain ATCC 27377 / DSM 6068 / ICPB 4128) TaxID=530564 RepID=D2R9F1_PIRSD|nr:hypothetical protein [Pirellula staleyi]ADB17701.1 hypothetical protein Psta_3036 [Pirellula staleyi DSM 6068]
MPIRFACPKCSQKLSVSSRKAGSEAVCPRCKTTIAIPAEEAPAAAPASAQVATTTTNTTTADAEEGFPQYLVFDDHELVYEHDEEHHDEQSAAGQPEYIAIPRWTLYAQGGLLLGVGLICFLLGILMGSSLLSTPAAPRAAEACLITGKITVKISGQTLPDAGAVVMIVPESTANIDERIPVSGLRPDDPLPARDQRGLSILRSIGGGFARCDENGSYAIELPDRGKYYVLVISSDIASGAASIPKTEDILKIRSYFDLPVDLLGKNRYRWTLETVRGNRSYSTSFP